MSGLSLFFPGLNIKHAMPWQYFSKSEPFRQPLGAAKGPPSALRSARGAGKNFKRRRTKTAGEAPGQEAPYIWLGRGVL
jgi:hypothetical protein